MLKAEDQRLLDVVKEWMTEPGTRTYLASYRIKKPSDEYPFRNHRTCRMSDALKIELINAGVIAFGEQLTEQDMKQQSADNTEAMAG